LRCRKKILQSQKLHANRLGVETEIPIDDWIDIGVLGKDEKELYLQKHKINQPEMAFEIVVGEQPVEAGIDPYVTLIGHNPNDHVRKMK
jgi:hypothetical protein